MIGLEISRLNEMLKYLISALIFCCLSFAAFVIVIRGKQLDVCGEGSRDSITKGLATRDQGLIKYARTVVE